MKIFIRHGHDGSNQDYKQDPSLNFSYNDEITQHTKYLIKKYGYPDVIYCSPFHRARQTAKIMNKVFNKNIPIFINNKCSRYFSHKERSNPMVKSNTLRYNPPIDETKQEFRHRVDKLLKRKNDKVVWYITHYLVIKRIAKKTMRSIPEHMPFLYTLTI
jgi:broad specificity phosphatase PhoE